VGALHYFRLLWDCNVSAQDEVEFEDATVLPVLEDTYNVAVENKECLNGRPAQSWSLVIAHS